MVIINNNNFVDIYHNKIYLPKKYFDINTDSLIKKKHINKLKIQYTKIVEESKFYNSDRLNKDNLSNSQDLINDLSYSMEPLEDLCYVKPIKKKKKKKKKTKKNINILEMGDITANPVNNPIITINNA